jgi:hypothetical protein
MKLKTLREIVWRLYQNGKAQANNQNLIKADIEQKVKLLFADAMRQRYYESKKLDEFGRPDYSFSSPILQIKRFTLSDAKEQGGFRRCDMGDFDLYRLPSNSHFTNIYPVGNCGTDEVGEITQVSPGEENFYVNDPDMKDFIFFVIKGRGVNFYNVPLCIKEMDIETTYDITEDVDIDMSIASAIVDQILNVALAIKKQYYSADAKQQMQEQNVVQ